MITGSMLVAKVRELATTHPNNVYKRPEGASNCFYTKGTCTDGSTGCIMGQAFRALGIREEQFNESDHCTLGSVGFAIDALKIEMAGKSQRLWLRAVQREQDGGNTWGAAVKSVDKYYSGVE